MAHSKPMWRDPQLEWTKEEYEALRTRISQRAPLNDESQVYRVLLCGALGAGKSSIINTILSAIRGEVVQIAHNDFGDESVTRKFRVYRFRESVQDRAIRVTMCDTRGFEHDTDAEGPSVRDMDYILSGHIKDGYLFDTKKSIDSDSEFFNKTPKAKDKVHLLVIVVEGPNVSNLSEQVVQKLRKITKLAKDKDIHRAVVLTRIDAINENIASDLTTMFSDEDLKKCVETACNKLALNKSNIFPIQNYTAEMHCTLPINILALHTLEHILKLADNTLESQKQYEAMPILELLQKTWRSEAKLTEEAVQQMYDELAQVEASHVPKLRVVLMGPCGGGKSAFINSAMSAIRRKILTVAPTYCTAQPSTTSYNEYILKQGREGAELDILLADTMGVLASEGLNQEDIPTILDGKVACHATFNPAAPLPRPDAPNTLAEQPHVLALVLNGAEIESYSDDVLEEMKFILQTAQAPGITLPWAVLVTQLDKVCQHVAEDPTKMFRSQSVQQCLESVKQKLGVPMPDILPVVNFADDTEIAWQKSALILSALQQLVDKAQDHVARIAQENEKQASKRGWFSFWK